MKKESSLADKEDENCQAVETWSTSKKKVEEKVLDGYDFGKDFSKDYWIADLH